jgi:hypothetical protein
MQIWFQENRPVSDTCVTIDITFSVSELRSASSQIIISDFKMTETKFLLNKACASQQPQSD